jgi:hypothetical protein
MQRHRRHALLIAALLAGSLGASRADPIEPRTITVVSGPIRALSPYRRICRRKLKTLSLS